MASDHQSRSASRSGGSLRELTAADLPALLDVLATDADAYSVVIERVSEGDLEPMASGGRTYGWFDGDRLVSALYVGANLTLAKPTASAMAAYIAQVKQSPRLSSAIVGYRDDVLELWRGIEESWGPCRQVRKDQPLLIINEDSLIPPAESLRRAQLPDLDALMQPSIDMFTAEVGVSPITDRRGAAFRARVASSILAGRTYLAMEGSQVVFKAEVGAVGGGSAQIQGVWLADRLRGQGHSVGYLAALVAAVRSDHASRLSLYVNHHNQAALRAYRRVGFRQVGTFATILF